MTKVKICGLTTPEDVAAVNEFKPDYAGFIFAPSRRRLTIDRAKELCERLNSDIKKVGVFVNEDPEVINRTKKLCSLDVIQIYNDDNKMDALLDGEIWLGVRVKDEDSLSVLRSVKADAYLLDAYNTNAYGGTGEVFNWTLAKKAVEKTKIILAGGLTPENVAEAVKTVCPYAVDVSSGVETDGIKDKDKIRRFIEKVRYTV